MSPPVETRTTNIPASRSQSEAPMTWTGSARFGCQPRSSDGRAGVVGHEIALKRQTDEESDENHRYEHPDERHGLPHFLFQVLF